MADLKNVVKNVKSDKEELIIVNKALQSKVDSLERRLDYLENHKNYAKKDEVHRMQAETFKCRKCNVEMKNECELKKHVSQKHKKNTSCKQCNKTFDKNIDLERHLKTHETLKNFKCNLCDKEFYLQWSQTPKNKSVSEILPLL